MWELCHQPALTLVSCRVALRSHLYARTLTIEIKIEFAEVLMLEHRMATKTGKSGKTGRDEVPSFIACLQAVK